MFYLVALDPIGNVKYNEGSNQTGFVYLYSLWLFWDFSTSEGSWVPVSTDTSPTGTTLCPLCGTGEPSKQPNSTCIDDATSRISAIVSSAIDTFPIS